MRPLCARLLDLLPVAFPHPNTMRNTAWLWFAGFVAWVVDGIVSLRLHSPMHAQLAFMVALVFFAAWLFYRKQKR